MPIDQRSGRELDVQVRLFTLLMRRGYTAPGVGQASSRALELAQRAPDPLQVAASLVGVSVFSAVRSDYPTSHACGEQLVALGQRSGDSALQYVGHTVLAMVGFLRGDLAAAVDHHNLATAVDAFDEARLLALFGIHFPSNCRAFAAAAHWLRGERDESQRLISEAIDLATLPGREFSLANAMMHDTMLGAFEGDGNRALASADQAIELAHKFRFVLYEAGSSIVRGWARASLGDIAGGEAELEEWYAVTQEMHATCLRPFHQGLLADIRRSTGRTDAALETVERAIGFSQSAGDRFWEPELHRLRGELLASLPDRRQDAEESLREAIAVASSQGARALEARARQSLTLLSTPSKAARPKRS